MGLGQILSYATRRIKPNQIRIRKRELDASNNRSFASEVVSSDYKVTALVCMYSWYNDNIKQYGDQTTVQIVRLALRQEHEI